MVTAETSNLGYFIAEAFAVPAIAAGTLATIVLFMFMQNWMMGVAAIALYPVQIYLIPKIQRRINELQRQEVQEMRHISQRIGDVVAGANEIHGHDTSQYELADFSKRLGTVFGFRVEMSSKRYIANVLNQVFSQLTPFFFLSVGGYLVIVGELSLGSLVAVLAAYKDMYAPWKDLIDYYQKSEDARVRYDQLKDFFARNSLLDKSIIESDPAEHDFSQMPLVASNVVLEKDEGHRPVDGATVTLTLPTHAAILGSTGSGRDEFARLLARQEVPHSGRVTVGDIDLTALPDSVTGRRIGFVGHTTHLGSGSIRDLLVYPLRRRPSGKSPASGQRSAEHARARVESLRSGNSPHDPEAEWIDYEAAGCKDEEDLNARMVALLRQVELDQQVFEFGLRRPINPERQPELADRLLEARSLFRSRLESQGQHLLIERFDAARYNSNASVAENILFGTPVGPYFAIANLGQNEYMRQVIESNGLTDAFLQMGRKLASIKSEIFRDLPPGHEFFERFSYIKPEDLPVYETILRHIDAQGLSGLDEADRQRLIALPFNVIESHDHEGLIDDEMKQRLMRARHAFARELPRHLRPLVQFFDPDAYSAASSIVDNILFGKLASSKAGSAAQIGRIVAGVVDELNLRDDIILAGLEYQVGAAAARLSPDQRQKVALARCLLKRPDILIMSEALAALETDAQGRVLAHIRTEMQGRSLILFDPHEDRRREFEEILVMDQGKFVGGDGSEKAREGTDGGHPEAGHPPAGAGSAKGLNEIVSVLMSIPLLAGIDRSKLKLLAFTSERVQFDKGQEVFHQGDAGNNAYVIIKGKADVVLESASGPKTVAQLGANDVFGEMALLAKIPRSTSIRAATDLTLIRISRDVFVRMVEENSEIALAMLRVLTERLAATLRDYGKAVAREDKPEADSTPG
jgi:ABC-type multidrug transport system fused ATPase/permease subunit